MSTFEYKGEIAKTEHRAISYLQLRSAIDYASRRSFRWTDASPPERSRTSGKSLEMRILNLYHMNHWIIRPSTEEQKCAFVELLTNNPQVPEWFISHWWGELVLDFLYCVREHIRLRHLSFEAKYWVCAYANRQHDLKADVVDDPTQTSFFKAMELSGGVLLVLDEQQTYEGGGASGPATPFTRVWCCFEESLVASMQKNEERHFLFDIASVAGSKPSLLIDGTCAEDNVWTSQAPGSMWKFRREAHFPKSIIQSGLKVDIAKSEASVQTDRKHILNCIAKREDLDAEPFEEHESYQRVNFFLRSVFGLAYWRLALEKTLSDVKVEEALAPARDRPEMRVDLTECSSKVVLPSVTRVLGKWTSLRLLSLSLKRASVSQDTIRSAASAISAHPLLTLVLTLGTVSGNPAGLKIDLLEPLHKLHSLKVLKLDLAGWDIDGLTDLCKWVGGLRGKLQEFELDLNFGDGGQGCRARHVPDITPIGDALAENIPDAGGVLKSLKLELHTHAVNCQGLPRILQAMGRLDLRRLSFKAVDDVCRGYDYTSDALAEALSANRNLDNLFFYASIIPTWSREAICFSALKTLSINASNAELLEGLSETRQLENVTMDVHDFDGYSSGTLAKVFRVNKNLRSLSLSFWDESRLQGDPGDIFSALSECVMFEKLLLHLRRGFRRPEKLHIPLASLAASVMAIGPQLRLFDFACDAAILTGLGSLALALSGRDLQQMILTLDSSEGVTLEEVERFALCDAFVFQIGIRGCPPMPDTLVTSKAALMTAIF